jgi:nitroreductase
MYCLNAETIMEFEEAIKKRRSSRRYKDRPVPEERKSLDGIVSRGKYGSKPK